MRDEQLLVAVGAGLGARDQGSGFRSGRKLKIENWELKI
jgi:hypothetical protein